MKAGVLSLLMLLLFFTACTDNNKRDEDCIIHVLNEFKSGSYSFDGKSIRKNIHSFIPSKGALSVVDRQADKYYTDGKPFIWIDRTGVKNRADSLLDILRTAGDCGIDTGVFKISKIENDIQSIRRLTLNSDLNTVMARIEYHLTKAFFRYSKVQRFGLVNPNNVYNNIEKYYTDSTTAKFRQLCNYKIQTADSAFYIKAATEALNNNLENFIKEIQPKSQLYKYLTDRLKASVNKSERLKIICNIERCRWRFGQNADNTYNNRSIIVNIPSFNLIAVDKDKMLTMRTCCGTLTHKTPLLDSRITAMDINPQWIVPKSMAVGYAGRNKYMRDMGMFVYDKKAGKLPPESVSYTKISEGEQYIIQAGGKKNSLGRIIFRFDNNFSVYLHDTSAPWLLQRSYRAVSHGCVRVEKPLELALFLSNGKDDETIEKIKYSMTVEMPGDTDLTKGNRPDRKRIVSRVGVKPCVPLFITYYTIFYDSFGKTAEFDDVYGYDEALKEKLKPYIK